MSSFALPHNSSIQQTSPRPPPSVKEEERQTKTTSAGHGTTGTGCGERCSESKLFVLLKKAVSDKRKNII
jgi:hypothetical protein